MGQGKMGLGGIKVVLVVLGVVAVAGVAGINPAEMLKGIPDDTPLVLPDPKNRADERNRPRRVCVEVTALPEMPVKISWRIGTYRDNVSKRVREWDECRTVTESVSVNLLVEKVIPGNVVCSIFTFPPGTLPRQLATQAAPERKACSISAIVA